MNIKEHFYLLGIDDAIQVLEDLRDEVSGAYEIGILTAISALEKYYDDEVNEMNHYEDGK